MNSQSNKAKQQGMFAVNGAGPVSNIVMMEGGFVDREAPACEGASSEREAANGLPCNMRQASIVNDILRLDKMVEGAHITSLSPQTVDQSLELPELRELLPCAVGFSAHSLNECPKYRVGDVQQATFVYGISGMSWFDMQGRRHEIREGKLLVIPADTVCVCGTDGERNSAVMWIHVVGTDLEFFRDQIGARGNPLLNLGKEPQLAAWCRKLFEIIQAGGSPVHLGRAQRVLRSLFNAMIDCHTRRSHSVREADRKIEQSIAYMKQHLDVPLHVGTLAALVSISPSHFFALFKRRTGTAPIDYFIRLRMRQACHLLNATTMSVKEVAATLGYEDPYYFSRMFKSVNDVAPSDYRAMRRGGQKQSAEGLEVMEAVSA